MVKILICASEYYPYNPMGGIGVCVNQVIKYLKRNGFMCYVCSPHGPDIKIPFNESYGFLSLLQYWHNVSNYFKQHIMDYDVIWLHQPFLPTNFPRKECIVTMHTSILDANKVIENSDYPFHLKFYYNLRKKVESHCIRSINRNASYLTVVSPHIIDTLEELGVPNEKIRYIPNGVDINKFKPSVDKYKLRESYGIPKKDIVFTYVGRITLIKQPLKLVRFFSALSHHLTNTSLVIVGCGELLKATKELTCKLGLKNVLFLGYIRNEELPEVYASSDFYIMTSIYEGQPLTIFEAMACGLPPIVSNIPVLQDIVDESNSGLVLDFSNIEESVNKTIQFINEGNLQKHSKSARFFIEDKHNWEKVVDQYIQIFSKFT